MEFKDELKTYLIPTVEGMVEREKSHLAKLKEFKNKISEYWFRVGLSDAEIDRMIEVSENSLRHLKVRLKEYEEYAGNE